MERAAAAGLSAGEPARGAPSARALGASLLAAIALGQLGQGSSPGASVDLYQFWGVGAARAQRPGLPTPWSAPEAYRAALERHFADESRPEALRVHRIRMRAFEPFGSPLLYLVFAAFPDDYLRAALLWRGLQLTAFALAVLVLARLAGWPGRATLLLPGALALLYRPFGDDLLTGNLNALQLAALAGLVHATLTPAARVPRAALLLCALAALALLKLNLAPAAAGLGLALGLRLGARDFGRACAFAAPGVAALLLAPCLYFRSPRAWLDWVGQVFADEPTRLAGYALRAGNTSTPRLLEEWLGIPVLLSALLLAALLLASLARVPRRAWRDPGLAAGIGVVAALAAAPLVWFHYFVLALLPGLWLAGSPRAGRLPQALAAGALLVYAGFYLPAVPRAALPALHALWALSWIPLWAALLVRARREV